MDKTSTDAADLTGLDGRDSSLFHGPVLKVLRLFIDIPGLVAGLLALGGCDLVLLSPAGDVAVQQRNLLLASTALMLLIILPVMGLTALFAWHYRQANTAARFDPDFHHSTGLEVLIWTAPLLIIIALGALTWISTHLLDPYRPVARLQAGRWLPQDAKPLQVDVVALDWKWLFFYPDLGIATVNELAAPVDVPLEFRITSASVMNSFFVPAMSGQIYAMAGMETQMHAVLNREGVYDGMSSNYSGAGFSHMRFKVHGLNPKGFQDWVGHVKDKGTALDDKTYGELEKPSEAEPVRYFRSVRQGLYQAILNLCAQPGKMCMAQMMAIDAKGGGGHDSEANRERLIYDGHRAQQGVEEPGSTFPASGRPPNANQQPQGMKPDALSPQVNPSKGGPGGGSGDPGTQTGPPPGTAPSSGASDQSVAPAQLHKH